MIWDFALHATWRNKPKSRLVRCGSHCARLVWSGGNHPPDQRECDTAISPEPVVDIRN